MPVVASIVIWKGTHKEDAVTRMKWINSALHVDDVWIEGTPGNWALCVKGLAR